MGNPVRYDGGFLYQVCQEKVVMSGETQAARQLIADAMAQAESNRFDRNVLGRAIINAAIADCLTRRSPEDLRQELQFTIDNLGEDEFVITRGC